LEAAAKAAVGGCYLIKINNNAVDTVHIPKPGDVRQTVTEYASPLEAIRAVEDYIIRRRVNILPHCTLDDITSLYPEMSDIFNDFPPVEFWSSPYYGRADLSVWQYELQHCLLYRAVAELVYRGEHNLYVVDKHPAAAWFEPIMELDAGESQRVLFTLLLCHCVGVLPEVMSA